MLAETDTDGRKSGGEDPGTGGLLHARIAALHATAHTVEHNDWVQIVEPYDELLAVTDGPVVRLSRAVAVGQADGPARRPHRRQPPDLACHPAFGRLHRFLRLTHSASEKAMESAVTLMVVEGISVTVGVLTSMSIFAYPMFPICSQSIVSDANVPKSVPNPMKMTPGVFSGGHFA